MDRFSAKSDFSLGHSMSPPGAVAVPSICYSYSFVMRTNSLQSCPTLCNAIDYSPPGSSVHGLLQARILEWVAMPSSRGSS